MFKAERPVEMIYVR